MASPNMVSVVANRSFVLTTTAGYSQRFVKGEPTNIPRAILADAMAAGVLPAEELPEQPEGALQSAPVDRARREDDIRKAIQALRDRNQRGDFTAAGLPRVAQVDALVGYATSSKEIQAVMQQIYDAEAEAE